MQVGAAVMAAGGAGALLVDRPRVVAMARVAQVELAAAGESLRGAAAARRHHAVEHVDAAFHGADDVGRPADAHQVARPVGGQHAAVSMSSVSNIACWPSPTARPPTA